MNDLNADNVLPNKKPEINLQLLDDEAIKSFIAEGYKLLDERKRERERAAKEHIKKLAEEAGIKVSFAEARGRRKKSSD